MSLTKAGLLENARGRFSWIEDVPHFGTVGVRSCPQLEFSMRWVTYADQETGEVIPAERAKAVIHEIIDQIMLDEKTSMFTDEDFDELAALDSERLTFLTAAIRKFNEEDGQKKG